MQHKYAFCNLWKLLKHFWPLKCLPMDRPAPKPCCCFCRISHSGLSSMQNVHSNALKGFWRWELLALSLKCSHNFSGTHVCCGKNSKASSKLLREVFVTMNTDCCHECAQIHYPSLLHTAAFSRLHNLYLNGGILRYKVYALLSFSKQGLTQVKCSQSLMTESYVSLPCCPSKAFCLN